MKDSFVYLAKLNGDGSFVVIKFVSRYNTTAQHFLAEKELAPRLLYIRMKESLGRMYGGLHMIVMEYFKGKNLSTVPKMWWNICMLRVWYLVAFDHRIF